MTSPNISQETSSKIAKLQKWEANLFTTKREVLLEETLYNNREQVIRHSVFEENTGKLAKESTITYHEDGRGTEIEKTFSLNNESPSELQREYIFGENGEVLKKEIISSGDNKKEIEQYSYNNDGRLISSEHEVFSLIGDEPESISKTNRTFTYTYDENGAISSKSTLEGNNVISRDSIFRNNEQKNVQVYTFDKDDNLEGSVTFRYNEHGHLISEVHYGGNGQTLNRYVYLYMYHTR
ncbi:MAG: hypothetical protein Kapaf2KO_03610 [Candidatus Kapaibacteriales bacterium]